MSINWSSISTRSSSVPIFIATVVLLLSGCQNSRNSASERYHVVTKVIDGDTFWIHDGTKKGKKIRLIGVDAPETRRSSRKEIGAYGAEAKNYLTKMLLNVEVRLDYDVDSTDRYGRTLAYAYLRDGTFVNAELIEQGYAMVLTVPPNVRFANEFVKLQRKAREQGRGLWKGSP